MKNRATPNTISRRDFIRDCAVYGLGISALVSLGGTANGDEKAPPVPIATNSLAEAMFWEPLQGGRVRCMTCPNMCERGEGGITRCNTRINKGGKLYTMTYGKPCYLHEDPLAKNPLYHVDLDAGAIGVATAGCNLTCKYCQNWDISQVGPSKTKNMAASPDELLKSVRDRNLHWITFSYTEPVAYIEYAIDAAKLAKKNGVRIAMSTAGFICDKPLAELIKYTDAFSVTFKGNTDQFYRDVCGCRVEDVKSSITAISKANKWMEVAVLIVPGLNDGSDNIRAMMRFLATLNRNIPVHFLRFAPAYKLANLPPTPVKTLETAHAMARKEGLNFVYIDLPGHESANTYCPNCGKMLIERAGFTILKNHLKKGDCPFCSRHIPGMFA